MNQVDYVHRILICIMKKGVQQAMEEKLTTICVKQNWNKYFLQIWNLGGGESSMESSFHFFFLKKREGFKKVSSQLFLKMILLSISFTNSMMSHLMSNAWTTWALDGKSTVFFILGGSPRYIKSSPPLCLAPLHGFLYMHGGQHFRLRCSYFFQVL